MVFAICIVPVSPMRAQPSHKSEMVSQLLFGEPCEIVEQAADQWIKIRCRYDGYEGWCQAGQVIEAQEEKYHTNPKVLASEWVNRLQYNGQPMMVPLGSCLFMEESALSYTGKTWNIEHAEKNAASMSQLANEFLNTPYLWGGKSVFGADCSGFTQTVFKFFGIPLLRDAWQQAMQGEIISLLEETRCGDLAFFDNAEGKITHVGILLNPFEIIHASGKVRIDKIDKMGIVNIENLQRTHQLKIIKRFF
jgi:cell wall-associated NlpC family hydrolase